MGAHCKTMSAIFQDGNFDETVHRSRTNWQLHLDRVQKMLPFFHASGNFFHSKSCHLYLQDMLNLHEKINPTEYEIFPTKRYFTIGRSYKFWSGICSDI